MIFHVWTLAGIYSIKPNSLWNAIKDRNDW
jgi:hypothetical protein